MSGDLGDRRVSYDRDTLLETHAAANPFVQFGAWIALALEAAGGEPYAMTLATADAAGNPSARVVLLRGWDERGFTFFTNYDSDKGREIAARPRAALVFAWAALERQVRIAGAVEVLSSAESDAYFARRPRGHQVSAWASAQSRPLAERADLERAMAEADARFAGAAVPRPPYWGGYRVLPERIEFWQGRRDRVHDRLVYARTAGGWSRTRLAP